MQTSEIIIQDTPGTKKSTERIPGADSGRNNVEDRTGLREVIEPWTIITCSTCAKTYHLADGSGCECGKKEAEELFKQHLGEYKQWI